MTNSNAPRPFDQADELAALYAVGALDADELEQAEQVLQSSETFAQQVSEYEAAVSAIPYSLPPLPLPANLKDRLFQRIAKEDSTAAAALVQLLEQSIAALKQQAASLSNWQPMPGTDSGEIAIWQADEARREVAFFARKPRGLFPHHAHASGEVVLVLEGDFMVEGQTYGVGDRIYATAMTHHQPSTEQGCLLLCISSMDDEILS
ncbi:MAG: anti-sigma factor [Leptolyngbya sp. SIO4C1]|nr:anti-sigma factor [Leptolyngbya sp. SIO4C1]